MLLANNKASRLSQETSWGGYSKPTPGADMGDNGNSGRVEESLRIGLIEQMDFPLQGEFELLHYKIFQILKKEDRL